MAKKRSQRQQNGTEQTAEQFSLADVLDEQFVNKLRATKKELVAEEKEQEVRRQQQAREERKQREKNKSFAELLDEYGDQGSKY